jgi:hypothetical protein
MGFGFAVLIGAVAPRSEPRPTSEIHLSPFNTSSFVVAIGESQTQQFFVYEQVKGQNRIQNFSHREAIVVEEDRSSGVEIVLRRDLKGAWSYIGYPIDYRRVELRVPKGTITRLSPS